MDIPPGDMTETSAQQSFSEKPTFPPEGIFLAKLPVTGAALFGREEELAQLDEAWRNQNTNLLSLTAWGGEGTTALVNEWLNRMGRNNFRGAERVYGWSFYSQGAGEGKQASADEFMQGTLEWFGDPAPEKGSAVDKGRRLAGLIRKRKTLLILDGLEPQQYPPNDAGGHEGQVKDPGLKTLLKELAVGQPGLCVVTTRQGTADLRNREGAGFLEIPLDRLSDAAGVHLLRDQGVTGREPALREAVREYGGHALALSLLGRYLSTVHKGDIHRRDKIPRLTREKKQGGHARRVMEAYEQWLGESAELNILRLMGLFDRPADGGAVAALKAPPAIAGVTDRLREIDEVDWHYALSNLRALKLLSPEPSRPAGTRPAATSIWLKHSSRKPATNEGKRKFAES